jgi:hypothetical protein
MSDVVNNAVENVANTVAQLDPASPAVQAVEAVVKTVVDPSPSNIVADFALEVQLADEIKSRLAGANPSILDVLKTLF